MRGHLSRPVCSAAALTVCLIFTTLATSGCGGASKAQKRAYKADEAVSKERLRLIDQYERCMRKTEGDFAKQDACERYLKSAEALQ